MAQMYCYEVGVSFHDAFLVAVKITMCLVQILSLSRFKSFWIVDLKYN